MLKMALYKFYRLLFYVIRKQCRGRKNVIKTNSIPYKTIKLHNTELYICFPQKRNLLKGKWQGFTCFLILVLINYIQSYVMLNIQSNEAIFVIVTIPGVSQLRTDT